jgi:hypothetical protein
MVSYGLLQPVYVACIALESFRRVRDIRAAFRRAQQGPPILVECAQALANPSSWFRDHAESRCIGQARTSTQLCSLDVYMFLYCGQPVLLQLLPLVNRKRFHVLQTRNLRLLMPRSTLFYVYMFICAGTSLAVPHTVVSWTGITCVCAPFNRLAPSTRWTRQDSYKCMQC